MQEKIESLMQTVAAFLKRVKTLKKQKNFFKISIRINWKERIFSAFCFFIIVSFCDYVIPPFVDWLLHLFH